ncbi:unnamed protein product [Rodentolepis nana]|uniref:Uncharacterized protein n=1 Tax=Rodentolepis nana TaxID=102285 RepID=A0A3P7T3W3_RODNA|nr:unnamed protein product [Rodentolepis nana]
MFLIRELLLGPRLSRSALEGHSLSSSVHSPDNSDSPDPRPLSWVISHQKKDKVATVAPFELLKRNYERMKRRRSLPLPSGSGESWTRGRQNDASHEPRSRVQQPQSEYLGAEKPTRLLSVGADS